MIKKSLDNFTELKRKVLEKEFSKMNSMQKKAIFTVNGPLLILAGAGSGKTTVVVNRIINLIKYGNAYHENVLPECTIDDAYIEKMQQYLNGETNEFDSTKLAVDPVKPYQILAITFTNKAAKELKDRLSLAVKENAKDIWASTFHSTCAIILRKNAEKLGFSNHFTIYDTDDSKRLIKECQAALNISDETLPIRSIMSEISREKNQLVSPSEYKQKSDTNFRMKSIADVYAMYQKRLKEADAMDFDDLLFNTVKLFKTVPEVLEYYQNRFKYIMVDEYQDTNLVQYEFIRLLSQKSQNLCVVGDDDQSIYKFRGATIENIMNFEKTFKNAVVIRLEQNYRSTKNILNAANAVIENNASRKGKTLWTQNSDGDLIHVHSTVRENDEAKYIVNKILSEVEQGRSFSDFAVLYRINSQSNTLEKALIKSGVPYRIVGGHRFYERREIKDVIAYFNVINNPYDEVRLMRIINQPKRSIGTRTLEGLSTLAEQLGVGMIDVMRKAYDYPEIQRGASKLKNFADLIDELIAASKNENVTLKNLYDLILEKTNFIEALKAEKDHSETRIENINELSSNILKYQEENPENCTLAGFLEEVALMTDVDNYDENANAVTLMTMHAAKGLEFPVVFLPGFEDGIFPGVQAINHPEDLEEERRLAYVAITRAKETLYIVTAETRMIFGTTSRYKPSRFLKEIPSELVEHTEEPKPEKLFSPLTSRHKLHEVPKDFKQFISYQPKNSDAYENGEKVKHKVFGAGIVVSATAMGNDTLIEIMFDKVGCKKLMANFAKLEKVSQ